MGVAARVNRVARRVRVATADWAYAIPHWVAAVLRPGDPAPMVPDVAPCGVPILIIPGVFNTWAFQRPLAEALHAHGHEVHVLPELGANARPLGASADLVAGYLDRAGLERVVVVAHSKGGLIAKHLLLDPRTSGRILGVVAACTPFSGSDLAVSLVRRSPLGMFAPSAEEIVRLREAVDVNQRIVSLCPSWDEMVPNGSRLAGARNVTLDQRGHFLPLTVSHVHDMIHSYVHSLSDRSPSMQLTAIAAVGRNGAIGRAGDVPWHLPEDWQRFKRVTTGCSLVMGRKTFDYIGRPLPGRTSIVITRNLPDERDRDQLIDADRTPPTRVVWVSSLDEALAAADPAAPVWIGGGAEIYRLAWDRLTDLDITEVDQAPDDADAFFPPIDPAEWEETSREPREGFDFVRYRRRGR